MGTAKYPIMSDEFDKAMLDVCINPKEKGMIRLLTLTGMHVDSLLKLTPESLVREGNKLYVVWVRPKTHRMLKSPPLFPEDVDDIKAFLSSRKCSRQWYHRVCQDIGIRAGYDAVSPMTFRHNRCVRLAKKGLHTTVICQIMGCTEDVVYKAYAKLHEDQLSSEIENERVEGDADVRN